MSKPTTNETPAVKPDATPRVLGKWTLPDNCVMWNVPEKSLRWSVPRCGGLRRQKIKSPSFVERELNGAPKAAKRTPSVAARR